MSHDLTFKNLEITGEISVRPLPEKHDFQGPYEMIMMMGPTGAGKSSFIEAITGNSDLGLSKNQLDGFTQKVSAYELVNVKWKRGENGNAPETIYILDTPGFSDNQISEMEIVLMVNEWMNSHHTRRIEAVIYACSATDTRIPRTKRRTINMLQSVAKITTNTSTTAVTIATTMWDSICNDQQMDRANNHFAQLRDEIWKDLTDRGGLVMKFWNTQASALTIIDSTLGDGSKFLALGGPVSMSSEREYISDLYQDLLERIGNAECRRSALELQLTQPDTQENDELKAITEAELQNVVNTLAKFERQLADFGDPPSGFGSVTLHIPAENLSHLGRLRQRYHSVKDRVHSAREKVHSVKDNLKGAHFPSLGRH